MTFDDASFSASLLSLAQKDPNNLFECDQSAITNMNVDNPSDSDGDMNYEYSLNNLFVPASKAPKNPATETGHGEVKDDTKPSNGVASNGRKSRGSIPLTANDLESFDDDIRRAEC